MRQVEEMLAGLFDTLGAPGTDWPAMTGALFDLIVEQFSVSASLVPADITVASFPGYAQLNPGIDTVSKIPGAGVPSLGAFDFNQLVFGGPTSGPAVTCYGVQVSLPCVAGNKPVAAIPFDFPLVLVSNLWAIKILLPVGLIRSFWTAGPATIIDNS